MARRPTKLEFHEHRVTCPYCRADITITSVMETIFAARRNCPVCKREMFIENGKAKMPKETAKQVRSRISKPRSYTVANGDILSPYVPHDPHAVPVSTPLVPHLGQPLGLFVTADH